MKSSHVKLFQNDDVQTNPSNDQIIFRLTLTISDLNTDFYHSTESSDKRLADNYEYILSTLKQGMALIIQTI